MGKIGAKNRTTAGGFSPLGTVLLVLLPLVTAVLALGIGHKEPCVPEEGVVFVLVLECLV